MNNLQQVEKAITLLGGPSEAARVISARLDRSEKPLTPTAVAHWRKRGVPAEYCIPIEVELEGKVKRCELRPDIYPPEEYGDAGHAA